MEEAFPEAMVRVPLELVRAIECIPDKNDRHVVAAAIMARADMIVTQNTKHFPQDCLERFGVHSQTPDDFLIRQYKMDPQLVLDKLDDQGAGISQTKAVVVASLRKAAPGFCKFMERHAHSR